MRIIASSDWHVDKKTLGKSRHDEIRSLVRQSTKIAFEKRADAYVFVGDLCDPDDGPALIRSLKVAIEAAAFLSHYGIPSYWLAGNHDVIEDGSGLTTLSPLAQMGPDVTVINRPDLYQYKGISILGLPYTATSHPYDRSWSEAMVKIINESPDRPLLVLSHLMIEGIQPGEETKEMPRGRDVMFPKDLFVNRPRTAILSGHYHKQQVFENIHVVGSIARLTMGERDNTPGVLEITI